MVTTPLGGTNEAAGMCGCYEGFTPLHWGWLWFLCDAASTSDKAERFCQYKLQLLNSVVFS